MDPFDISRVLKIHNSISKKREKNIEKFLALARREKNFKFAVTVIYITTIILETLTQQR